GLAIEAGRAGMQRQAEARHRGGKADDRTLGVPELRILYIGFEIEGTRLCSYIVIAIVFSNSGFFGYIFVNLSRFALKRFGTGPCMLIEMGAIL
ncbi:MAG: hypothetical protein ACT7A5_35280, partial [Ferrovibrionaceae bacterium]